MHKFRSPKLAILMAVILGGLLAFSLPAGIALSRGQLRPSLAPVGTGFTYQGHLESSGSPANGPFDFQFLLFDAPAGGNQVGATQSIDDLPVVDGYFQVNLDFGQSAFGSGERWLQINVRPGVSGGAYTPLTPRQELSPSPYALALPNVYTNEATNFVGIGRDFRISGNEVFGVRYTGSANQYGGMYVETSNAQGWPFYGYATNGSFRAWTYYNGANSDWYLYNAGVRLKVPNEGGLRIGPSTSVSLVISNTTSTDGVRIMDTNDDALQIGVNADVANYGVYIPSPGVSTYGLWSNTANASGQWALYSVDNIQAGNVFAQAYTLVSQVSGPDALNVGDLVAVTGAADPLPGGSTAMPVVRLADSATYNGVIGVVSSRMIYEVAPGKEAEGEMALHSAEGPAQPGDYVALTIYGIAEVNVDPSALITPGQRLTASSLLGRARPLLSQEVNGMVVTEGAPVIGVALREPLPGETTIPVFVTLR